VQSFGDFQIFIPIYMLSPPMAAFTAMPPSWACPPPDTGELEELFRCAA
jgi:hypothetical protein